MIIECNMLFSLDNQIASSSSGLDQFQGGPQIGNVTNQPKTVSIFGQALKKSSILSSPFVAPPKKARSVEPITNPLKYVCMLEVFSNFESWHKREFEITDTKYDR